MGFYGRDDGFVAGHYYMLRSLWLRQFKYCHCFCLLLNDKLQMLKPITESLTSFTFPVKVMSFALSRLKCIALAAINI